MLDVFGQRNGAEAGKEPPSSVAVELAMAGCDRKGDAHGMSKG